MREVFAPDEQRNVHKSNQHRNFHQRPDNRRKGLTGIYAENGNGHGYRQFKVV